MKENEVGVLPERTNWHGSEIPGGRSKSACLAACKGLAPPLFSSMAQVHSARPFKRSHNISGHVHVRPKD
jgi:hypothetical protein